MKTTTSRFIVAAMLLGSLALISGCGKKAVTPYTPPAHTSMPEGKELDYSQQHPGEISEENMEPKEETLDTASSGHSGGSMGSLGVQEDQNSPEYKRLHGRSSAQLQPIYFDFDQSTIREDQIGRLEHNAEYLNEHVSEHIVIEGNCDERGTNEYNLALGERRALSAKKYLIELGVDPNRIRTVSYGEERPLFTGSTEDDWAQNRRDDFVIE